MDPLNAHFTLPPLMGSRAKPATDLLHHPGESLDPLEPPLLFIKVRRLASKISRDPLNSWKWGSFERLEGGKGWCRKRIGPPHFLRAGTKPSDIIMGSAHPRVGSRVG